MIDWLICLTQYFFSCATITTKFTKIDLATRQIDKQKRRTTDYFLIVFSKKKKKINKKKFTI